MIRQLLFLEKDRLVLRNEDGEVTGLICNFDTATLVDSALVVSSGAAVYKFRNVHPGEEKPQDCTKFLAINFADKIYIVNAENVSIVKLYHTSDVAQRSEACLEIRSFFSNDCNIVEEEDTILFCFKQHTLRSFVQVGKEKSREIFSNFARIIETQDTDSPPARYSLPTAFGKNENKKRKET
jgi:hypothetical protein